jgi:hypothetical protein
MNFEKYYEIERSVQGCTDDNNYDASVSYYVDVSHYEYFPPTTSCPYHAEIPEDLTGYTNMEYVVYNADGEEDDLIDLTDEEYDKVLEWYEQKLADEFVGEF